MGQAPAQEVVSCRGAGGADGGCSTRHVLRWAGSSRGPARAMLHYTTLLLLHIHVLRDQSLAVIASVDLWVDTIQLMPACVYAFGGWGGGGAACMWSWVLHTFPNTG
jgi:hypothetical protein